MNMKRLMLRLALLALTLCTVSAQNRPRTDARQTHPNILKSAATCPKYSRAMPLISSGADTRGPGFWWFHTSIHIHRMKGIHSVILICTAT
jgi:hypothetical protein